MIVFSYGYTRGETKNLLEKKKLMNAADEVQLIDPLSWSDASPDELVATQGLFADAQVFFVDHVLSELEPENIVDRAANFADSPNIIVFIEDTSAKHWSTLEKKAEHIFAAPAKKEEAAFNIFSLSDGLFAKDKKQFWLLYQRALAAGTEPEEMHRILFWGTKQLALANVYSSATAAGMSSFVYGKAKRALANWKEEEIARLAERLTDMLQESRRGEEWEILLEKFILGL